MMNLEQVKLLVEKKELKTVEFKKSTALLRQAFTTLCAFLNGQGGTVLIGVTDQYQIVGQHVSDGTRLEIANETKRIEPTAPIDVHYVELKENKFIIVLHVEAGEHAPYIYDGRAYQRDESQTNRMSQHRYEQLLVKRSQLNHSWETFIAENHTINDLDKEEIYRTVMDGIAEKRIPASIAKESVEKILRQLKLIRDKKPKRAAMVLFGKDTESDYAQCWLKMARFQGIDKGGNFIDNQQVYCNVFRMLVEADNFLHKHLPMASYFKKNQFKRIDKFALPVAAVREALVNAICHRDYADRSGYISIAIFDDGVEIWNNGTLPNKLKIKDLKHKHDSVLRNELIAKTFYSRGYIESWGTGIKTMMDSCKEHGIPAPKFAERTGGFVVTFKFAELIGASSVQKKPAYDLNPRQEKIIAILKKDSPLNVSDILARLQSDITLRTVNRDLFALKKLGFVEQQGSGRGALWKLKTK